MGTSTRGLSISTQEIPHELPATAKVSGQSSVGCGLGDRGRSSGKS